MTYHIWDPSLFALALRMTVNMNKKQYTVYILTNKYNKVLYVGITNNIQRRIYEHKNKLVDGFTKLYNVHKLIYAEYFGTADEAITAEKKIKGWTRKKKITLIESINPEWKEFSLD